MMKSKKGVTEDALVIGVLIMSATFLALGTASVLVPLIKTEAEFLSTDLAITVNILYAAPESISADFILPEYKLRFGEVGFINIALIAEKDNINRACVLKGKTDVLALLSPISGLTAIIDLFTGNTKIEFSGDDVTTKLGSTSYSGSCRQFIKDKAATTKEFSFQQGKATIKKVYDGAAGKNILEKK